MSGRLGLGLSSSDQGFRSDSTAVVAPSLKRGVGQAAPPTTSRGATTRRSLAEPTPHAQHRHKAGIACELFTNKKKQKERGGTLPACG